MGWRALRLVAIAEVVPRCNHSLAWTRHHVPALLRIATLLGPVLGAVARVSTLISARLAGQTSEAASARKQLRLQTRNAPRPSTSLSWAPARKTSSLAHARSSGLAMRPRVGRCLDAALRRTLAETQWSHLLRCGLRSPAPEIRSAAIIGRSGYRSLLELEHLISFSASSFQFSPSRPRSSSVHLCYC